MPIQKFKVSDEQIDKLIEMLGHSRRTGILWTETLDTSVRLCILKELKERRKLEQVVSITPLDIKGQLRLVRDRCPDLWDKHIAHICTKYYGLRQYNREIRMCGYGTCKECWDKALEVTNDGKREDQP